MQPMKSRERVLAALNRQPVDRIPYIEHLVDPTVGFRAATPEQLEIANQNLTEKLGTGGSDVMDTMMKAMASPDAAATGFSEQMMNVMGLMDPELSRILGRDNITFWGGAMCFEGGINYLLDPNTPERGASADGVLKTFDDLSKMKFADIEPVVAGAKKFLQNKEDFAACALIFLGLDPTWHSMGFETFCESCLLEPELVAAVLGPISDWYAAVAEELCKLDFDFIWAADDIAYNSAPFFSPRLYRKVLLPHTRKVAQKITKPWIYHSDGNLLPIWEDLTSQGMNAIHPLEAGSMDLQYLKDTYGDRISFVGGIDLRILEAGTVEETEAITKEVLSILGRNYGYLLSTSNSVTPNVIPQNLVAMLKTGLEYGVYDDSGKLSKLTG